MHQIQEQIDSARISSLPNSLVVREPSFLSADRLSYVGAGKPVKEGFILVPGFPGVPN